MDVKLDKPSHTLETTIFRWVLLMGSVFLIVVIFLFWYAEASWLSVFTFIPLIVVVWLLIAFHIKSVLERHFYSLANVIESLRMGDYSMRIAAQNSDSAWSDVYREINLLAEGHQKKRLQFVETDILLDKLLAEFDVPVFVFDRNDILKNINDMGCELFAKSKSSLLGMNLMQLHLNQLIEHASGDVVEHWFPSRGGRWELRKNYFIQGEQRYSLLLVNDLSRTLREEERSAWLRLIRVLGHELNNSLASMISVSETLITRLNDEKTQAWHQSYGKALSLMQERSKSLLKFTEAYTKLAKLPTPEKRKTDLLQLVQGLSELLEGEFAIKNTEPLAIDVDPDQLQQLLINLMKNAVEASSAKTPVSIQWQGFNQGVRIQIIDQGIGLPSSDNLFVPFYTTKPDGNGIGLFLCRQIAEAHNGTLRLINRSDQSGCIAECWLPYAKTNAQIA